LEKEIKNPRRKVATLDLNRDDVLDVYASYFETGEPYEFINIPHQVMQTVQADTVTKDGRSIGISTNPAYSYYFRKMLTIAYIDVHIDLGTQVEVLWGNPGTRQKVIRATVAQAPYKPDKRKSELNTLPRI
jgi:vanillate/3-O-methylgallate O-demethylase